MSRAVQGERGREVGKFSEVWHRDLSPILLEQGHIFALGLSFSRNIPDGGFSPDMKPSTCSSHCSYPPLCRSLSIFLTIMRGRHTCHEGTSKVNVMGFSGYRLLMSSKRCNTPQPFHSFARFSFHDRTLIQMTRQTSQNAALSLMNTVLWPSLYFLSSSC